MRNLTADEIREITPTPYMVGGCEHRLEERGLPNGEDSWIGLLTLRAGVAIAGHLDRIATALENGGGGEHELRRITDQLGTVCWHVGER